MLKFGTWCSTKIDKEGDHDIVVLSGDAAKRQTGIDNCAAEIPSHYGSPAYAAHLLSTLGKKRAAAHLKSLLPTKNTLRSGDLGEIMATSYVAEQFDYKYFIKRLRYKDHREMAMRGDDLVAVREGGGGKKLEFLKAEVKSRVALGSATLNEARTALRKDNNRPSPHALAFIAERLSQEGKNDIAGRITDAQLKGLKLSQVEHLLFTFSQNNPLALLKKNLAAYKGKVAQVTVGVFLDGHQGFIKAVFDKVLASGKKP